MTTRRKARKTVVPEIVRLQQRVRRTQLAAIKAYEKYAEYYAAHPREQHLVHEKFL